MLNPTHLRTLVVVVRTGSFAQAARMLGYTPSAVSQQIAALERTVRTPLFEREAHSVTPTPTALVLAERALDVLAEVTGLEQVVAALTSGEAGRIRVGSFPTASRRLVPAWLARLRVSRPDLEVVLDEDEPDPLAERLRAGELDISLAYVYDLVPPRWPPGLWREAVLDEDLLLVVPAAHPLASREHVRLADLADETWVAPREASTGARCVRRACAAAGFEPRVAFRSNDYGVVCGLVSAGLGIAVVPAMGAEALSGVVVRRVPDLTARRHMTAVRRTSDTRPAVAAVIAELVALAADLAEPDDAPERFDLPRGSAGGGPDIVPGIRRPSPDAPGTGATG